MTTAQAFRKANITHAVIVDDAFDPAPAEIISHSDAGGFFSSLSDSDFEIVRKRFVEKFSIEGDDVEESLVRAACTLEGTRFLFEIEESIASAKLEAFQEFRSIKKSRMKQLEPLCARLRELEVEVQEYGSDADFSKSKPPQFLFIDLQLRPVSGGAVEANDAIDVYRSIVKAHPDAKPFVFLMSSIDVYKKAEEFRSGADLFFSQFEAVRKEAFQNSGRLDELLSNYSLALHYQSRMHCEISNVHDAVKHAAERLKEDLLNLDIADYRVLQANTASIEQMSLGNYVLELVLDYAQYLIEDDKRIWGLSGGVESWHKEDIARSRFGLRRAAGKIYQGTVLHASQRLIAEEAGAVGPANGFFYLGDIFIRKGSKPSDKFKDLALCVVSPACDLARPEDLQNRTLFLCEGKVKRLDSSSVVPAVRGGVAPVVMTCPDDQTKMLMITWDLKRFRAWDRGEMAKLRRSSSAWKRIARLRPLYALQLQHAMTADLSRIGTQRAPAELIPHGVELLCRKGGIWVMLDREDAESETAAAISVTPDKSKFAYVISDPTVSRFREQMTKLKGVRGCPVAKAVKAIDALKGVDRRLMFCEFETKERGEKKKDLRVLPLSRTKAHESTKESIAFASKAQPTPYSSASGGSAETADQKAVILVRFIPLRKRKK